MIIGLLIVLGSAVAGVLFRFLVGRFMDVPNITSKLRWIFIGVFVLGGLLTIYQSVHLKSYDIYKKWVMIHGTVTKAEVVEKFNYYKPLISYAYAVNGNDYTGTSDMEVPGFGGKGKMFDVAEVTVKSLAPGSIVPVFYDPEHPETSKLRVTPTWNIFAQIGFGAFLIFCSLFGAALPAKKR